MPGDASYFKGKDFKSNPQNINRTGANKKTYKRHIDEIKAKGYEAPKKNEFYEMIGLLLSMTEADLKEFALDKDRPYWIRCIVTDLNDKKNRQRMMADHRDWLFGKAEQKTDLTSGGEKLNITLNLDSL